MSKRRAAAASGASQFRYCAFLGWNGNRSGYTRLSQRTDVSIERQKELIRDYCAESGFDLVGIYDDGQRSAGFDDDREAYNDD